VSGRSASCSSSGIGAAEPGRGELLADDSVSDCLWDMLAKKLCLEDEVDDTLKSGLQNRVILQAVYYMLVSTRLTGKAGALAVLYPPRCHLHEVHNPQTNTTGRRKL
jgi:hypothetical protein